jgi:hypothetical protein
MSSFDGVVSINAPTIVDPNLDPVLIQKFV